MIVGSDSMCVKELLMRTRKLDSRAAGASRNRSEIIAQIK